MTLSPEHDRDHAGRSPRTAASHHLVRGGAALPSYNGTLHWWSPETTQQGVAHGFTKAVCGTLTPLLPDFHRRDPALVQCGRCRRLVAS